MKKLLVGGYYDERSFEGEHFLGMSQFKLDDINIYTVKEALEIGCLENVVEHYQDNKTDEELDFESLTEVEQATIIERYAEGDDMFSIVSFKTEEQATAYYLKHVKELEELEARIKNKEIIFSETKQNREGRSYECYILNEQSRLSLDNGTTYISIHELSNYKDEIIAKWEAIVNYMNTDTRELIHADLSPCSELEFLTEYLKKSYADLTIG